MISQRKENNMVKYACFTRNKSSSHQYSHVSKLSPQKVKYSQELEHKSIDDNLIYLGKACTLPL